MNYNVVLVKSKVSLPKQNRTEQNKMSRNEIAERGKQIKRRKHGPEHFQLLVLVQPKFLAVLDPKIF